MVKPGMGERRVCASCGARFYDLSRDPIRCPKCAAVFVPPPPATSRRGSRPSVRRPIPGPVPEAEADTDTETAEGDAPLLEPDEADDTVPDDEAVQKDE